MAFFKVRSNQMLNIKFHMKKKELRNKSDIWLWISKSIVWHKRYFYLYWIFGFYFEFISVQTSCRIQCFSLYSAKQWISVLTFKYLFWFHWDKYLALARIWFAFYLYEEPILIRTTRDAWSDKSWNTKDEISSLNLAGAKKQNQNQNGMNDKNTNAQEKNRGLKRHCWVFISQSKRIFQ